MVFYTTAGDARGELERLVNLESRYVVICQKRSQLKFVRCETSEWKFTMNPPHLEKREIDARRRLQALNVTKSSERRCLKEIRCRKIHFLRGRSLYVPGFWLLRKTPQLCAQGIVPIRSSSQSILPQHGRRMTYQNQATHIS